MRNQATALSAPSQPAVVEIRADVEVKPLYLEALGLLERLHRKLLDVVKDELERRKITEINAVQALLLYNIADGELTAGELRTRGYYLGSNVSYNVKKLVDMGYMDHQRSRIDRRAVRISLTQKGRAIHLTLEKLLDKHTASIEPVGGLSSEDFRRVNVSLGRLERFWTDHIKYRL